MSYANQNANKPSAGGKGNPMQDYVTVAERIEKFYERYPEGRIVTHIIEHDGERGFILMRAEVYRNPDDAQPSATGHAYEYRDGGYVQKTSYIEVGETSSVGRALALCGFEVKRGIASREDMEKQGRQSQNSPPPTPQQQSTATKAVEPDSPKRTALIESVQTYLNALRKAGHPVLGIKDETKEKVALKHASVGFLRSTGEKLRWANHETISSSADLTTRELEQFESFLIQELKKLQQPQTANGGSI
jgi:hypothetical protein